MPNFIARMQCHRVKGPRPVQLCIWAHNRSCENRRAIVVGTKAARKKDKLVRPRLCYCYGNLNWNISELESGHARRSHKIRPVDFLSDVDGAEAAAATEKIVRVVHGHGQM